VIPHVVRGDRMVGLTSYLAGPGRHNEHADQHIVAGSPGTAKWPGRPLGHDDALALGSFLDEPRKVFGKEIRDGSVWHCSLSLTPEEEPLSDETWAAISRDFVAAMGFDTGDLDEAPCRWVSIRHGASHQGNDHVHIAVSLVRENGRKADTYFRGRGDFQTAQNAARQLEVKYGLTTLESVKMNRATRGWHPADLEMRATRMARAQHRAAENNGAPAWAELPAAERQKLRAPYLLDEQPRDTLARTLRACAAEARDEADFVRLGRQSGLLFRPYFKQGSATEVTGYAVAQRPPQGERPIFFGAVKRLGYDLGLARLRRQWPQGQAEVAAAEAEWQRVQLRRPPSKATATLDMPTDAAYTLVTGFLRETVEQLAAVPTDDFDTWTRVARRSAGLMASWAARMEPTPGPLAAAADSLSKAGQTKLPEKSSETPLTSSFSGIAGLLAVSMAKGNGSKTAQALLLAQLIQLVDSIGRAMEAADQARLAKELLTKTSARLTSVHNTLRPDVGRDVAGQAPTAATPDLPKADPADTTGWTTGPDGVPVRSLTQGLAQRATSPPTKTGPPETGPSPGRDDGYGR
jgi:hypothetical protein